ncbi:MAG: hypothetical protein KTR25_07205 [Myxococcales bacterium]|nr:hypothetical protein [Myxococcales bacterium]
MVRRPVDLFWTTVSQLTHLGEIDHQSLKLGFHRTRSTPPVSAVWIGRWGDIPLSIHAEITRPFRRSRSLVFIRIQARISRTPVPMVQLENTSHGWVSSGSAAAAAWIRSHLGHPLSSSSYLRISPSGFRWESTWSTCPKVAHLLDWLTHKYITICSKPLQQLLWASLDPPPGHPVLRETLYHAFLSEFPGTPEASELRTKGVRDVTMQIQLTARTAGLGPDQACEGARWFARANGIPQHVRLRALNVLLEAAPSANPATLEWIVSDLTTIYKTSSAPLRAATIRTCLGLGELGQSLIQKALEDSSPTVQLAGIQVLSANQYSQTEAILLDFLIKLAPETPPSRTKIALSIMRELGNIGTIISIPVLSNIVETAGLNAPLNEEALSAIRQIRTRHPHLEHGYLAVIPPAGGLSESG